MLAGADAEAQLRHLKLLVLAAFAELEVLQSFPFKEPNPTPRPSEVRRVQGKVALDHWSRPIAFGLPKREIPTKTRRARAAQILSPVKSRWVFLEIQGSVGRLSSRSSPNGWPWRLPFFPLPIFPQPMENDSEEISKRAATIKGALKSKHLHHVEATGVSRFNRWPMERQVPGGGR